MESTFRSSVGRWLPWVALVTVWFLWGSTYLAIRVAVGTIPPLLMAGTRYVIAGAVLSAVLLVWKRDLLSRLTASSWRSIEIMGFSLLVLGNGMLCYVETVMPSGIAAIIVATVPIWMVVIDAVVSRTAVRAGNWIGLGLGTAGIATLAGFGHGAVPLVPALMLLLGAFSWAAGSVYARRNGADRSNPIVPALEMFVGGIMLVISGALTGEFARLNLSAITPQSIAGFWWLVTGGAIVGYSAYGYAVRRLPTNVTATYGYVNPIVAVILGAWFLQEPVTWNELLGGGAVVLAVVAILKPAPSEKEDQSGQHRQGAEERVARVDGQLGDENRDQHGEECKGCPGVAGDAA
jgi:drug/metabolite transporter (DMT)-like permease